MIKEKKQMEMSFSKHMELYEILIEKDNLWRQLKEMVDFGFVIELLKDKYSSTMGRTSEDVIRMFKYLLLKQYFKMSDRGLVERTKTDMLFKYFLDYEPEETKLIDPSLLTVFRRERINGKEENLMDELIKKTVEIAIKEGIVNIENIITVDSTHTNARYYHRSPREELIKQAKELRKTIYKIDENMKERMPKKRETSGILEEQIEYTKELVKILKEAGYEQLDGIREQIEYLRETAEDIEIELKEYGKDQDAKIGHKTADTSFFGYKTHIAETEERIITGAVITSGEKHDGKQLKELIEKTERNGIEIKKIIGDGAYSEEENIRMCEEKEIKLVSKLNKMILEGHEAQKLGEYEYNKDADMYVCKAGHMAIKKEKDKCGKQKRNVIRYYFDVEKCKKCPLREGCYKEGAKKKTFTVTVKKEAHKRQAEYMETEEFKELYKERYKIEAKNAELKNNYDYGKANACGKVGMTIQGASTLFLVNMKRIIKLKGEKKKKEEEKER